MSPSWGRFIVSSVDTSHLLTGALPPAATSCGYRSDPTATTVEPSAGHVHMASPCATFAVSGCVYLVGHHRDAVRFRFAAVYPHTSAASAGVAQHGGCQLGVVRPVLVSDLRLRHASGAYVAEHRTERIDENRIHRTSIPASHNAVAYSPYPPPLI